ncbi:MAG: 2-hydroxychromene-2-carboxylate isomerase [Pseudolabrys sp.]|nr:2-hydroxychromene-2-carboxylate isomerase [Pseudolabrys sp.]MBV9261041.1 2-hydroxychromene-2-carboxylate isomerase [Pseudolabrys sp.]
MSTPRPTIEYFFSFLSLWSYVGSLVFQDVVKRNNATIDFKPINLFDAFEAGGSKKVRERPVPRQAYRLVEMKRWRDRRGIPLTMWPKYYPVDTSLGHRMLLAAVQGGHDVTAFAHAGLKAVWADELNVADPATLIRLADVSGLNGQLLLKRAGDSTIKAREGELTREAMDRQVFGAPFYFYRGEPFWGQDRLDHLEQAIESRRAPILWPDPSELDPTTARKS